MAGPETSRDGHTRRTLTESNIQNDVFVYDTIRTLMH